jgi:hypothetical protein
LFQKPAGPGLARPPHATYLHFCPQLRHRGRDPGKKSGGLLNSDQIL